MRHFFLLFFFLIFSSLAATEEIVEKLSPESDALSLLEGTVNLYSGQMIQIDKDLLIAGSDPLELTRIYDAGSRFNSDLGYGVGISFPLKISCYFKKGKVRPFVEMRRGVKVPFKMTRVCKNDQNIGYEGGISYRLFETGYTNSPQALLKGERSLLAARIQATSDQKTFIVFLGDGTKRHYERYQKGKKSRYRLVLEERPNGNYRHFTYRYPKSLALKRVWTTSPGDTLVLNAIDFEEEDSKKLIVKAHQGEIAVQDVLYTKESTSLYDYFERDGEICDTGFKKDLLKQVSGSRMQTTEYCVKEGSSYSDALFRIEKVARPDKRTLFAKYLI